MNARTLGLALFTSACSLAACGGSGAAPRSPSSTAPSSTATDTAGPAPAESGTASEEEAATVPTGKVLAVTPKSDATPYARVRLMFENPTPSTCRFTSYTLNWPGGKKTIEEKPFDIPPAGRRRRTLRVHPDDGDLSTLTPSKTLIDIAAGCSPP
jgi:hypothetical protein